MFSNKFILLILLSAGVTGTANAQAPTPLVAVVEATRSTLYEELPLSGTVSTRRLSRLSPKLAGLVDEMLVDAGDEVMEGDAILKLDNVLAQIELDRVRSQLNEAIARNNEAIRQRDEAEELIDKKHIAATSYENLKAEVDITAATVSQLQAAVSAQRELLDRHTVYAPFDGVITQKLVEAGEWVSTNTPLFQLTEVNVVRLEIPVPQFYFNQIDIGTPVKVMFDAIPGRVFDEAVSIKVPMAANTTRTFPVRIDMMNVDRSISPGMSVRARILLEESSEHIIIPRDAIVRQADGRNVVWLVEGTDGVRQVSVQTGRSYIDNIEIIEGMINEGDQVIVRGNETLTPDQKVRIQNTSEQLM